MTSGDTPDDTGHSVLARRAFLKAIPAPAVATVGVHAKQDESIPEVLTKDLPTPGQFVSDENANLARGTGRLVVDTDRGFVDLHPDGDDRTVTAVAGFLAADALTPTSSWEGVAESNSKRVGTAVVTDRDELAFASQTFDGIAFAATSAVDFVVDGVTVDTDVTLVRYTPERGLVERRTDGDGERPDSEVEITGTILEPDGSPAAENALLVYAEEDEGYLTSLNTDSEGRFSYRVRRGQRHDISYYQLYDANPETEEFDVRGTAATEDGVPDLFAVTELRPTSGRDLGEIQLPEAFPLDVTVVDGAGDPVEGAAVVVEHYNDAPEIGVADTGVGSLRTNADGKVVFGSGTATGVEVRGETRIKARPPENSDRFFGTERVRRVEVTEPTAIEIPLQQAFVDDYSGEPLDRYEVVAGSEADWDVQPKIDGPSLHAVKNEGKTFVVLDSDRYSWSGDRDVAVDFTTATANYKKNAYLVVGDGPDRWFARVGVQGDAVNLFYDRGSTLDWEQISKQSVSVTPGEVHTLTLRIRDATLILGLDGTDHVEYTHDEAVGEGSVGVGTTGGVPHETWFDNLTVRPPEGQQEQ